MDAYKIWPSLDAISYAVCWVRILRVNTSCWVESWCVHVGCLWCVAAGQGFVSGTAVLPGKPCSVHYRHATWLHACLCSVAGDGVPTIAPGCCGFQVTAPFDSCSCMQSVGTSVHVQRHRPDHLFFKVATFWLLSLQLHMPWTDSACTLYCCVGRYYS